MYNISSCVRTESLASKGFSYSGRVDGAFGVKPVDYVGEFGGREGDCDTVESGQFFQEFGSVVFVGLRVGSGLLKVEKGCFVFSKCFTHLDGVGQVVDRFAEVGVERNGIVEGCLYACQWEFVGALETFECPRGSAFWDQGVLREGDAGWERLRRCGFGKGVKVVDCCCFFCWSDVLNINT